MIRLAGNLVLTRLLVPEAFGLMSLVSVLMSGLQMFSDIGIGPSIIRSRRSSDPAFLNTAWTIQVLRGLTITAIAWAAATPYAAFYGHKELFSLLLVTAFNAAIGGFNSTRLATQSRELALGRLTVIELLTQVVALAVMIGWVAAWPSVWGLVAGGLAGSVTKLVCSYTLIPGSPNRLCWDPTSRREIMSFGRWIFVSTVLTFLASQMDRLVFGKRIPLELFGVYANALVIATIPTQIILRIGNSVVFPIYSRIINTGGNLRTAFGRVRHPLLVGSGMVLAALAACGPSVVRVIYDSRYHEAGWMVQVLVVGGWFQTMSYTSAAALLATGHSKAIAFSNLVKLVSFVTLVPLGFAFGGFEAAIWTVVVSDCVKYVAICVSVSRLGYSALVRDILTTVYFALTAVAGCALGVALEARGLPNVVIAVSCGILVCAAWGPMLYGALRSDAGKWRVGSTRSDA